MILISDCPCDHKWTEALITVPPATDHIVVCLTSLSESLLVSERGGSGEICSFFPSVYSFPLSQMVTAAAREILFGETALNIYKSLCLGQLAELWYTGI